MRIWKGSAEPPARKKKKPASGAPRPSTGGASRSHGSAADRPSAAQPSAGAGAQKGGCALTLLVFAVGVFAGIALIA